MKGGKWEKCNSIINKIYLKKKNSIGNVEAKELICITQGHDLRWGKDGGRGVEGRQE